MIIKKYISDVIPALKTSDTGVNALNWMEVFRVSHLAIVNNEKFLGIISDTEIYDLNKSDEPIGSYTLGSQTIYVKENQHIYEAFKLIKTHNLTIVPVVDEELNYKGAISLPDLIGAFGDLVNLNQPGGILVLEMLPQKYSLAEIAQIVEGNNARILSAYVSASGSTNLLSVTIKINTRELSSIIRTFERYDYYIKNSFDSNDLNESLSRERYEALMNYLDI